MVSGFGCQVSAVVFPVSHKKDSPRQLFPNFLRVLHVFSLRQRYRWKGSLRIALHNIADSSAGR